MATTRLTDQASFTVSGTRDAGDSIITFLCEDSDKTYNQLMVVLYPLGDPPIPPIEQSMDYDSSLNQWSITLNRPSDACEMFYILPNIRPDNTPAEKEQITPVAQGYLSLKDGIQQPVNKTYGVVKGELRTFVYTSSNELMNAVDQSELQEGERLITLYFPPGYDQTKAGGYHFQVVLDGEQYLNSMQMNSVFDNLVANNVIEPTIIAFISPYTGAPDPEKEARPPATPAGYSIAQRFKEYSCNPAFAERMSMLPDLVRQKFNITSDPEKTTIWGLSMGGLQATYTALIYPDTFGVVVAQSPMAWNIPKENKEGWREEITEDWTTSAALLPEKEQHNEYLSQMVKTGVDILSGRSLVTGKSIRFHFDAGSAEEKYDPDPGFANLVEATRILSRDLRERGHRATDVVIIPGGHNAMTWMVNISDVATSIHSVPVPAQEQLEKIFNDASIPALSVCWRQDNATRMLAGGVTDTSDPRAVDSTTLFQAASVGKPVSAAIVLDLVKQNQWDLDTSLSTIADYGPPEIRADKHYNTLTIRMIIGQCSGLPNWFNEDGPNQFLIAPGERFIYSGVALEFLKEVIEEHLGKPWEVIAQDFFAKVGMTNSTYQQSVASNLYGANVAREHQGDLSPIDNRTPSDSEKTFVAGSLLTTATDYIVFLQYCLNNPFLKSTLLTGSTPLGDFPKTPGIESRVQWGLGVGIYRDEEKTLAFHWGNNTGSHAFCAMNIDTGDCVACFVNSENGPNVFQALSEAVVGDMGPLFEWLSHYCAFNAASPAELSISPTELIKSVNDQHKAEDRLAVSGRAMQSSGVFSSSRTPSPDSSATHVIGLTGKKV